MLYRQFCEYVECERLFEGRKKLLIALSGGPDSMVLSHLLFRYKEHSEIGKDLELALIHCNFKLRGEDSERDAECVRDWAAALGWPLFEESFDTQAYAARKKISIEMAARELRYDYFARVAREEKFDACLLAHHADDNTETFFINIARGTGLRGLRGMLPVSKGGGATTREALKTVYLRPLLFAGRDAIVRYAHDYHVDYRIDKTNADPAILRNAFRNTLFPLLDKIAPRFRAHLSRDMEMLRGIDAALEDWYDAIAEDCVKQDKNEEFVSAEVEDDLGTSRFRLFFEIFLMRRSFNAEQIGQILRNQRRGTSGREFVNRDASVLLIREPAGWRCVHAVEGEYGPVVSPFVLPEKAPACKESKREMLVIDPIDPSPRKAFLNMEKLQFPLTWRHWVPGDKFKPLGTRGFKKLSDFFKEQKIGATDRQKVWLLCSGKDIVWVAGYRIDDRYKLVFPASGVTDAWVVELED